MFFETQCNSGSKVVVVIVSVVVVFISAGQYALSVLHVSLAVLYNTVI